MFTFPSGIADKIWALCSVSLAAQLATLPITIYYFHQFPVLFLVTNLVLIPISICVMYGGILVLIFSKVTFIAKALVWITAILIKFMNGSALFFDRLPFCIIDNIHISIINMSSMYVLIILVFAAYEHMSYKLLMSSFSLAIIMLLISLVLNVETKNIKELVIYHSDKSSALGIFSGNNYVEISDSIDERLAGTLRENKIYHDFTLQKENKLANTCLIYVGIKKILFTKNITFLNEKLIQATNPDYIWIPSPALKNKKFPENLCSLNNLIISGRVWNKKTLSCLNNSYLTTNKGAFIVSLP